MLEELGHIIAKELDDIVFIGVQEGFGTIPDYCSFNCMRTGTTFNTNCVIEAQQKLKIIKEKYRKIDKKYRQRT